MDHKVVPVCELFPCRIMGRIAQPALGGDWILAVQRWQGSGEPEIASVDTPFDDDGRILVCTLAALGYGRCTDARRYEATVTCEDLSDGSDVLVVADASPADAEGIPSVLLSEGRIRSLRQHALVWLIDSQRRGSVRLDYLAIPDRASRQALQHPGSLAVVRIRDVFTIFSDLMVARSRSALL